ncbi:MAG: EF-P beta-lysylation protein EpmB [Pseudomonadota bacterium]|nr:MAG: EF-P beta-lysylation protein EpmB [Pseudomonadota bacterium]
MIPRTPRVMHASAWQAALAAAVRDPLELLTLLELPRELAPAASAAAAQFPLRVPRGYLARMEKGNPHDPLLRQILPLSEELRPQRGFVTDPVGDLDAMAATGVLHKYHGRALLVTTGACAVHCRYCFRRHFPYSEAHAGTEHWTAALDYLRADTSIHEVILSGGDPLSLGNGRLHELMTRIGAIDHVRRLRIHTRQPIVLPERVDAELLRCLRNYRLPVVVVVHCNHPNEIDAAVCTALGELRGCIASLLNQSVLLRRVNDDSSTLAGLSETLFRAGVLPYYLHLLDPVAGAGHFAVAEAEARALLGALRARLPGYLVPQLVRERRGAPSKTPLV